MPLPSRENIQKAIDDGGYSQQEIWDRIKNEPEINAARTGKYSLQEIQTSLGLYIVSSPPASVEPSQPANIGITPQPGAAVSPEAGSSPAAGIASQQMTQPPSGDVSLDFNMPGYSPPAKPPVQLSVDIDPSQPLIDNAAMMRLLFSDQPTEFRQGQRMTPEQGAQARKAEMAAYERQRITDLQTQRDWYSGSSPQINALINPSDLEKKAFPITSTVGRLGRILGAYALTGGIENIVSSSPNLWIQSQKFGPYAEQAVHMAATGAHKAVAWGASKLADQVLRVMAYGDKPTTEKLLKEPLKSVALGGLLGTVRGIEETVPRIFAAAGAGGAWKSASEIYKKGKIDQEGFRDILLFAALTGGVEALGSRKLTEFYKSSGMKEFLNNKTVTRMMHQGLSWEEASKQYESIWGERGFLKGITQKMAKSFERPAFETMIKEGIPGYDSIPADLKEDLIRTTIRMVTKDNIPFSAAIDSMKTLAQMPIPEIKEAISGFLDVLKNRGSQLEAPLQTPGMSQELSGVANLPSEVIPPTPQVPVPSTDIPPNIPEAAAPILRGTKYVPPPVEVKAEATASAAKGVFKLSEKDKEYLPYFKGQIEEGKPGYRGHSATAGEEYTEGLTFFEGAPSTYPDWFKDKGLLKSDVLRVIEKIENGEPITEAQTIQQFIADELRMEMDRLQAEESAPEEGKTELTKIGWEEQEKIDNVLAEEGQEGVYAEEFKDGQKFWVGKEQYEIKKEDGKILLEDGETVELRPSQQIKTKYFEEEGGDIEDIEPEYQKPVELIKKPEVKKPKAASQLNALFKKEAAELTIPESKDQKILSDKSVSPQKKNDILTKHSEEITKEVSKILPMDQPRKNVYQERFKEISRKPEVVDKKVEFFKEKKKITSFLLKSLSGMISDFNKKMDKIFESKSYQEVLTTALANIPPDTQEPPSAIDRLVPPEFMDTITQEAGIAASYRPVRHPFGNNALAYYGVYDPIKEGVKLKHLMDVSSKKEAYKIAGGLSKKDLEDVVRIRENMSDAPKKIKPEVQKMVDYFDEQYPKLLKLINDHEKKYGLPITGEVKRYSPRFMQDSTDELESALWERSWGNKKIPKELQDWFFKKQRTGRGNIEMNSLKIFDKYVQTVSKYLYLSEPIKQARNEVIPKLPPNMAALAEEYVFRMLGYPAPQDVALMATINRLPLVGKISKSAQGLDPDKTMAATRFMIDLSYMGLLGGRISSPMRNLLQTFNNTVPELGGTWVSAGVAHLMRHGFQEASDAGVLLEYAPELYKELGEDLSKMDNLRNALLFLFQKSDEINRAIAYYGALKKFDFFHKRYLNHGNVEKFMSWLEVNKQRKFVQYDFKKALEAGDVEKAKHIFAEEVAAKTQYLYNKEDSPIITRHVAGKVAMQMKSWPLNYIELINDWIQNKHWQAGLRSALMALLVAGATARMKKSKARKMIRKSFFTQPLSDPAGKALSIPPVLQPLNDAFKIMLPGDFNSRKSAAKRLKKDMWNIYVPGGLAMREYYEYYERRKK